MKKFIYLFFSVFFLCPSFVFALEEEGIETGIVESEIGENVEVSQTFETVILEECIDGNTVRFRLSDDSIMKARFLAIDVPTIHPMEGEEPFQKEVSEYTCSMLTNAQVIKLEYDENSNQEDSYGRKLVWVFVDDVLLQDLLVTKGYAEVSFMDHNYKYNSVLQEHEREAKSLKLGIWSLEDTSVVEPVSQEEAKQEEKKEDKGFFRNLLDQIIDFFNDLLEKLIELIENML